MIKGSKHNMFVKYYAHDHYGNKIAKDIFFVLGVTIKIALGTLVSTQAKYEGSIPHYDDRKTGTPTVRIYSELCFDIMN